uniref:Fatty acyl-CoA reductase n=1 Tax=Guillardia theta TaxID=55529 RepID=A0A7S4K5V7_GUITH
MKEKGRGDVSHGSRVRSQFSGSSVLITGCSGFLGKALLEKILRCCPEVETVYVLLRSNTKNGSAAQRRLQEEIFPSSCFNQLRRVRPESLSKCRAVQGDVCLPRFGMSEEDFMLVKEHVNYVFHCAATINFNEHLKTAFKINVDSMIHLVDICKSIKKLEALIHVSTAYVNAPVRANHVIPEEFRSVPADYWQLKSRVDKMSREEVSAMTEEILESSGHWPNSYCLTKCIGELVLRDLGESLPYLIVRPTIVTCAYKEPEPGWIDTLVGPTGLVLAVAAGVLHVAPGRDDFVVDFIPVDFVVNCMLSCAWFVSSGKEGSLGRSSLKIVNIGSSGRNPIPWKFMLEAMPGYYHRHPTDKSRGPIFFRWTRSSTVYRLLDLLLHQLPAVAHDVVSRLKGGKADAARTMKKIKDALGVLKYFTMNEWFFESENMYTVLKAMSWEDMYFFDFDVRSIIWDVYFTIWSHGMKVFLLKEGPVYYDTSKRSRL